MSTMNLNLLETGITQLVRTDSESMLQFIVSELAFRGLLITLLSIAAILVFARKNASERSLLWLMLILALALMPGFALWLPEMSVALAVNEEFRGLGSSNLIQSLASLPAAWSPTLQSWMLSLYASITFGAILYLVVGMISLQTLTRRSIEANQSEHAALLALLQGLHERSGMNNEVRLLFSDNIQSPLTWGLFRHIILLPTDASHWPKDMQAQCLSHELAHIQRMDWASHMLSRLVLCIYWFNPVNWWLHNQFVEDSEMACDQTVIDDTGCAITYAENLLWIAHSMRKQLAGRDRDSNVATALLKSRSALYRRVRYILAQQYYYSTNGRTGLLASIVFSVLLVAPASAVQIEFIEEQIRPPPDPQPFQVLYYPRGTPQYSVLMGQFGQR